MAINSMNDSTVPTTLNSIIPKYENVSHVCISPPPFCVAEVLSREIS